MRAGEMSDAGEREERPGERQVVREGKTEEMQSLDVGSEPLGTGQTRLMPGSGNGIRTGGKALSGRESDFRKIREDVEEGPGREVVRPDND